MSRFTKSSAAKAATLPASNPIEDIPKEHPDFTQSRQEDTNAPRLWFIPDDLQFPPRVQKGPAHAKRKPKSHIPKARNIFFLFRSLFVGRKVLPAHVAFCQHNRQVSRIASHVWRALPEGDQTRFRQFDEEEKRAHQIQHPGYQWTTRKVTKMELSMRNSPIDEAEMNPEQIACKRIAELVLKNLQGEKLATRIQEVLNATLPASWLDITTLSSDSFKAARKNGAAVATPKPASKALVRQTKRAVKNSRLPSKVRSSSSKSKKSKTSLDSTYARFTNPSRRKAIRYSQEASNDEDDEHMSDKDTEHQNSQSSRPPTSVTSEDIRTPSRFSSPLVARDTAEGSFDWAKDMAIHTPAFGDEGTFEPYEDHYSTVANGCPYTAWSIQFPSGLHAHHAIQYCDRGARDALRLQDIQMAMGELSLAQDCLEIQSQTISPERLHL